MCKMDSDTSTQTDISDINDGYKWTAAVLRVTQERPFSPDPVLKHSHRPCVSSCSSTTSGSYYTCSETSHAPESLLDEESSKDIKHQLQGAASPQIQKKKDISRTAPDVQCPQISPVQSTTSQTAPDLPTPPYTPIQPPSVSSQPPRIDPRAPIQQTQYTRSTSGYVDLSQPFHPWSHDDVWFPVNSSGLFIPPTHVFVTNHGVKHWDEAFYWLTRGCRVWTKEWREVRLQSLLNALDPRGELTPEGLSLAMWSRVPKSLWWSPSPSSAGERRTSLIAQPTLRSQGDVGKALSQNLSLLCLLIQDRLVGHYVQTKRLGNHRPDHYHRGGRRRELYRYEMWKRGRSWTDNDAHNLYASGFRVQDRSGGHGIEIVQFAGRSTPEAAGGEHRRTQSMPTLQGSP